MSPPYKKYSFEDSTGVESGLVWFSFWLGIKQTPSHHLNQSWPSSRGHHQTQSRSLCRIWLASDLWPEPNRPLCPAWISWWRHQMDTFPALRVICAGNSLVADESLLFSLICVWINSWVSNREAGDLRRYRTHYDVIVMRCTKLVWNLIPMCTKKTRASARFISKIDHILNVYVWLLQDTKFSLKIIIKKMAYIKNHPGVNCEESRSSRGRTGLRLYGLDKMATIMQTIFSNAFSWMKMCVSWPQFNLRFIRAQLIESQHWFR